MGGGGTTPRGAAADAGRQTYINWKEAALTGPAALTGDGAPEALSLDEHLKQLLGVSEWDPKPTLLYFHRDHEEGKENRAWDKQCGDFNDESIARWSQLYRFVEIDVAKSDAALLERFGMGEGPSFSVLDRNLEVVAKSGALVGGKKVVGFLQSTVKAKFDALWKDVSERLDAQRALLTDAKDLEKAKNLQGALDKVREVTRSWLRVGEFYDDAVREEARLVRKLADD